MSRIRLLIGVSVALAAHLIFGWAYSIAGAVLAGSLSKGHPVHAGMWTLVITWGGLVIFNLIVATSETMAMFDVIAQLIGGLPAVMTVSLTMGIGAVLGALGGWIGSVPVLNKKD